MPPVRRISGQDPSMDGHYGIQAMQVSTSRFGKVEIDQQRVVSFSKGILGFPHQKKYVLLQPDVDSCFYWLQAIDREDLAFVVTDPSMFIPSYRVPIKTEQMRELNLESLDKGQVFVIVNKNQNTLTGNLQGPLVINAKQCVGEQLVLSNHRFTAREPLMELGAAAEMVSA